jgi:hypothetical protein
MSLSALNWRYVGAQGFASGTVAAALDALNTLGTAATYADGTTRTPGSSSAWTWSRYQNAGTTEAMYATPPTDTLNHRIIFAGQAAGGTKTPTMASPDTSATVIVMCGLNKNSGAFNAWDNVAPFTSGTFSGYYRCWPGSAGAGTVYLYESQEAVVVLFATTAGSIYAAIVGAFLDPESTDTANDAESDGKLYGMCVSGSGAVANSSWWTATNTADLFRHNAANGTGHATVFTPGGSTLLTHSLMWAANAAMTTSGLKTRSGRWGRHAIAARFTAAAPNDQFCGRYREICAFTDAQVPSKQTNAGSTIGYIIAASTTSTTDAAILLH